jgi:hypothetical protein
MHNLTPSQHALIVVGTALVPGALRSDPKRHRIPDRLVFWGAGRPGVVGEMKLCDQSAGPISMIKLSPAKTVVMTGS